MFKMLNYDTAAYETSSVIPSVFKKWCRDELQEELINRIKKEKERIELQVYYYRIGYTMAFPLPVSDIPLFMPKGINDMSHYPWSIWLSWELRERWNTLYAAWKNLDDYTSAQILQNELSLLANWRNYFDETGTAGLCTAHFASCLARFLKDKTGWDKAKYDMAMKAANRILNEAVMPWFEVTWKGKDDILVPDLANIPCIVLMSSAYLADVIQSVHSETLREKSYQVLEAWRSYRLDKDCAYTEGTAYDGYFLDSATEWLNNLESADDMLSKMKEAFRTVFESWLLLTLPGRADIHAPIGDVEPEMPFWTNVMTRFLEWYDWHEGTWLLRHIAPVRLPTYTIGKMLYGTTLSNKVIATCEEVDLPGYKKSELCKAKYFSAALPSAAVLRTGWDMKSCLVAVSNGRAKVGHLHYDNGHIVIGHQGRFWITDPGYQQYRPGQERDFTLGEQAHNVPVVNGTVQTRRAGKITTLEMLKGGLQHLSIDISGCYETISDASSVIREVWLVPGENYIVAVRDSIDTSKKSVPISYYWQGGTHLAWSFTEGWARLSNGVFSLWIGTNLEEIKPVDLLRHEGTRGPLTLRHLCNIKGNPVWWVFSFDSAITLKKPEINFEGRKLVIKNRNIEIG